MKLVTAKEAAALIPNGSTVALSGSCASAVVADNVLAAMEEQYLTSGTPKDLTVFHPQGVGDKDVSGLGRFAHPGLCRRVIGGHWGMSPKMGQLAASEQLEAYNLPQGVMA